MKFFINYGIAIFTLFLVFSDAEADWKKPREMLDQRLLLAEFRIHYTLDGNNAFPFDVPRLQRAEQAAIRLSELTYQIDQASQFYRKQLKLMPPLSSPRYQNLRSIDLHVINLKGKMGTTGDAAIIYRYKHFTGALPALTITLSNQWHPPNLTPNHEVFHAYQYAYTFFKNPWYLEGMARSLENAFKRGEVQTEMLPRDHETLGAIIMRSYNADLFWNRLMYLCDFACSGSTPESAWHSGSYTPNSQFCGAELVRSTLEQFQLIDKEVAHMRRINANDWPEKEQRSYQNNPFLLRGLRRAIESQCLVDRNPELKAFYDLLGTY